MIFFYRFLFLLIFHISLILPAKIILNPFIKSTKIYSGRIADNQAPFTSREINLDNMNDSILVLWGENFESGENGWYLDSGWEITESNADSPSPTHSILSPNSDNNQGGVYNLLTPILQLPTIGTDETMHFGFYLYADLPDSDGDDDGNLDDYYSISILDISESAWHSSDFNTVDGNSFWCADEDVEGYLDSWIQYLDTPSIPLGSGGELSTRIFYTIESKFDDEGNPAEVDGSCTDGWDAANIRISKDGGITWSLLEDSLNHPYHFDCGYGWIWNDDQYEAGGSLNHLAKGWGGSSNGWADFSADLSEYANQYIIIRFAFGSDPAYSTANDDLITGFQVDDITVSDNSGELFSNNGEDLIDMTATGEVWIDQFYDYGSVEDDRPGADEWELYLPGMPFNGNTFLNISEFAGKTIKLRIQSRYDDNHDGGQGGGLYIDDFMIYKLSTGAYFAPWGLEAEAGDSEVSLVWSDMNATGTADFVYDDDDFELDISVDGWAGELFDIIGTATINSFKVYNNYQLDTTISVGVYGMFGSTIDTEPIYTKEVPVHFGWNDVNVTNWNVENYFIIAHKISSSFGAAFDTTNIALRSYVRFGEGAWEPIYNYVMEIDGEDVQLLGEFGIRANITYEGAGVSYNVYRDELSIETGLTVNGFTDNDVVNNTTYEYTVSATYDDGEESGQSSSIIVTPLASTVHQESHDDGSFESEFNAGSGNFSAVKFSANLSGEEVVRFKWFQIEDGGAFYIKVFEDNEGVPGIELFSAVQATGNEGGWNEKDLSEENITVSGDYWIGTKEFSSSRPFGLDIDSISDNSFQNTGYGWSPVSGNLGYRCFLNSEMLRIEDNLFPVKIGINQIYPNPFNPVANIQFEVAEFSQVKLSIIDVNGRLVSVLGNGKMNPGQYQSLWDGNDSYGNQVSSGIYLAVFESNGMLIQTRKLILLK